MDPYLTEIFPNFQKGVERLNLLLVVLPPLAAFDEFLERAYLQRARTAASTQFIGTMVDYETLLLQMTAGVIRRLVFVFPIDERINTDSDGSAFEVWESSARVLGRKNCFWNCTETNLQAAVPQQEFDLQLTTELQPPFLSEGPDARTNVTPEEIQCFVCRNYTLSPLRLKDRECLHAACSLACMQRLHCQWVDIRSDLRTLDRSGP